MERLRLLSDGALAFHCPGCNDEHCITPIGIRNGSLAKWEWNGSMENPTFHPSVLVTTGHYCVDRPHESCWCTYNKEHEDNPAPFSCRKCHSFVCDGMILFLNDCSHSLAGQKIMLPTFQSS